MSRQITCDRCKKNEDVRTSGYGYMNDMTREVDLCPLCYKEWKKRRFEAEESEKVRRENLVKDFLKELEV